MAEHFRFFDSANPLAPDRTYNAQEFTDYFKALVTTGVMRGTGNELKVTTNGGTMVTTIDTGIAFLLGRYYENDGALALTHEIEAVGKSRIDRVVIRMNLNPEARNVKAFVKRGVASTNPVAPTLTQTEDVYEISLAKVLIVGGQTFISSNSITDERGKDIICPWAGSKILPNFDDSALEGLVNGFNDHITAANPHKLISIEATGNWDSYDENGVYYGDSLVNSPSSSDDDDTRTIMKVISGSEEGETIQIAFNRSSRKISFRQKRFDVEGFFPYWDTILTDANIDDYSIPKIETGEYLGNGANSRVISTSEPPKLVIIVQMRITGISESQEPWGAHFLVNKAGAVGFDGGSIDRRSLQGLEDGYYDFQVGGSTNSNNTRYKWVAFTN